MNVAFIDGQNLYLSLKNAEPAWRIDLARFRVYLKEKYKVETAYYFLGTIDASYNHIYEEIQKAGFILVFKKHNSEMLGKKKGNIDTDLVFYVMKKLYKNEIPGKVILVSGDGDYRILVDFLIEENKFEKILFPNQRKASSLYRVLNIKYKANLNTKDIKRKIMKR